MRLDGLPVYEKKRHGIVYYHAKTCDSDTRLNNHKEAKRIASDYMARGYKCLIDKHGNGFLVYVSS